jgi:hypothetical protein
MVDRSELAHRGLRGLFCRRRLADISIDKRKARGRRKAGLGSAPRRCHHVIPPTQKCLNNRCSDALRGSGCDHCLLSRHTLLLLLSRRNSEALPCTRACRLRLPDEFGCAVYLHLIQNPGDESIGRRYRSIPSYQQCAKITGGDFREGESENDRRVELSHQRWLRNSISPSGSAVHTTPGSASTRGLRPFSISILSWWHSITLECATQRLRVSRNFSSFNSLTKDLNPPAALISYCSLSYISAHN